MKKKICIGLSREVLKIDFSITLSRLGVWTDNLWSELYLKETCYKFKGVFVVNNNSIFVGQEITPTTPFFDLVIPKYAPHVPSPCSHRHSCYSSAPDLGDENFRALLTSSAERFMVSSCYFPLLQPAHLKI